MPRVPRLALPLAAVVASMLVLFTVPTEYFVAATFGSTAVMIAASAYLGGIRPRRPAYLSIALGAVSAALLYLVFYGAGWLIGTYHPLGMTSASEGSIYSLIAAPGNPLYLQVAVLLFDATGYEAFFRGVLQKRLQGRLGIMAAPAVAAFDAALHVATFNLVWVGATFVADLAWGLTYHYGKGTQGSFTSHILWDLAIFVVRPIH